MKTVAIIQARMGSSRLPGKVLLDISGKPLLWHIVSRLRLCRLVDKIVVATSIETRDDPIGVACSNWMVDYFRGSEEDVLSRYYEAAIVHEADPIVRIAGDCPLIDFRIVDKVIARFIKTSPDYLSTGEDCGYLRGLDVEVFTFPTLEKAYAEASAPYDREHATSYIYNHPELFKVGVMPKINLSVDTQEDLDFVRHLYDVGATLSEGIWRLLLNQ